MRERERQRERQRQRDGGRDSAKMRSFLFQRSKQTREREMIGGHFGFNFFLTKGISPNICILCVRVKINKRSFEPFCVWIFNFHVFIPRKIDQEPVIRFYHAVSTEAGAYTEQRVRLETGAKRENKR